MSTNVQNYQKKSIRESYAKEILDEDQEQEYMRKYVDDKKIRFDNHKNSKKFKKNSKIY